MLGNLVTGTSIADAIASIDKLDKEDKDALRIKIKHLVKKGFLENEHDPNATATSPKYYRKRELGRAAVLTNALMAGFETEGLAAIAKALATPAYLEMFDRPPSAIADGIVVSLNGLDAAIKGVFDGDPGRWLLTVSYGRSKETGKPVWKATVSYLPKENEHIDAGILTNEFISPIFRGEFDLTERFTKFGWMLRD